MEKKVCIVPRCDKCLLLERFAVNVRAGQLKLFVDL